MRHRAGIKRTGRRYAVIVIAVCAVILLLRPGCHCEPPDLTACTRIEVHYTGGALYYFFRGESVEERVLSEEERTDVRSFDKWTVTDRGAIQAFAGQIRQGSYRGRQWGIIDDVPVDVACYKGRARVASFAVHARSIVTRSKCEFAYPPGVPILRNLDPPGLKSLQARWECATNLSALVFEGLWFGRKREECPDPNHWCDAVLEAYRSSYIIYTDENDRRERMFPDSGVARRFTCPGAHAPPDVNEARAESDEMDSSSQTPDNWISDYAMNSDCREGSPDDTVFLFESQPGWNRHGGLELFTFGNHDPQGGCILLKRGTVKFIRTEEELHALRWK